MKVLRKNAGNILGNKQFQRTLDTASVNRRHSRTMDLFSI